MNAVTLSFFAPTGHSLQRQHLRAISDAQLDLTLKYGHKYHVPQATAYYLRRRDIPHWVPPDIARHLHATVVIVALDGSTILTTYQNKKFLQARKTRARWA